MDYAEALTYLHGRLRLGVKLGNERFLALLQRLGDPQERLHVVHIAGTKGKGSTTAMAASILQAAGYTVGQYLSPYVYDVRERIQINREMIPQEDFARLVTQIEPHVAALERTDLGPTTEFELKTAIGLCWFAEQGVDYAVLEVGLGGRLDATNVVARPLVTAITNIGLDHTELLGDTLGKIAREKAGIVKRGVPCVTGVPRGGEAWGVIAEICREKEAPLIAVGPDDHLAAGRTLTVRTPRRVLRDVRLRLRGAFQHANAAVAAAALDAIRPDALPPLSDDAMRRGLEDAYVPGRLEQVADRPTVIVDVGHNELAAQALAAALRDDFDAGRRRLILVVGLSRQHLPGPFLEPLAALRPAALVATQPGFRPLDAAEVAVAARRWDIPNVQVVPGVAEAARRALALAGPDDLVCLTGSFYTVGDVPPALWSQLFAERNFSPCPGPSKDKSRCSSASAGSSSS
ncbi:MAG: bifunctional folylpolyglutamate synthase/dihydrofolate synthase [Armatimonadetes bacterium]|nr:bifunctional folylpolyglutamate synthase/dihydrofolate synthase [Armatimonadota bacterium]